MRNLLTLALPLALLGACVEPTESDLNDLDAGPDASLSIDATEAVEPPERVGDFCRLDGCDQAPWSAESGWAGDLECQAVIGSVAAVCTDDEICHVGIRFHGAPFGIEAPPEETCPSDANGNGQCAYAGAWYTLCAWE